MSNDTTIAQPQPPPTLVGAILDSVADWGAAVIDCVTAVGDLTLFTIRVGCAMAAELGTMRVTEQIDALESMGTNPIHYLVVPRVLASIFMIPTLTIMADFMGVVGGYLYSIHILHIDEHHYWKNSEQFVQLFDLFSGILKSVSFGGAIALVSCYRGFNCTPGAEGVGRAATSAFVWSFVLILAIDLFLGKTMYSTYYYWFPQASKTYLGG